MLPSWCGGHELPATLRGVRGGRVWGQGENEVLRSHSVHGAEEAGMGTRGRKQEQRGTGQGVGWERGWERGWRLWLRLGLGRGWGLGRG